MRSRYLIPSWERALLGEGVGGVAPSALVLETHPASDTLPERVKLLDVKRILLGDFWLSCRR